MSSISRNRILARLFGALPPGTEIPDLEPALAPPGEGFSSEEAIRRLKARMAAVNAEIHVVASGQWRQQLQAIIRTKSVKRFLYGPDSAVGRALVAGWTEPSRDGVEFIAYDASAEALKQTIFQVDAGLTGTLGAVAETGAVILKSSAEEPRLLSLVPPIHFAVLDAAAIYPDLATAMQALNWSTAMPTNMLLISGPSKTADIEFTLAYGVHGPKELVVLIRT